MNFTVAGTKTILIVDSSANLAMGLKEGRSLSRDELKDNTVVGAAGFVGGFAVQNVFSFKYLPGNLAAEVALSS